MSNVSLFNAGKCGHSTADILQRLDKDVLRQKPELVILLAGTNDMLNVKKIVDYKTYKRNMNEIISKIKAYGAKIILITMPPCSEKLFLERVDNEYFREELPSQRITEGNRIIFNLSRNKNIPVVDFYAIALQQGDIDSKSSIIINPDNSAMNDGVHPTAKGYQLLAEAVYALIAAKNLLVKNIVCLGDSITYGAYMKDRNQTYPKLLANLLKAEINE